MKRRVGRSDHFGPSALERGHRPARDMFAERRARLCLAACSDERNEMRLGENAALLIAPAHAWHVIQDWPQKFARAIVIARRKRDASTRERHPDLVPHMRESAGLLLRVPLHPVECAAGLSPSRPRG